jgi:chromate reductase
MSPTEGHRLTLLTVCGSLQRASTNAAALTLAERPARAQGHDVDSYRDLGDLPAFNVDRADAPGPAVERWRRRVGHADVVLLAVPEYAGGMAGVVKNALDWLVGSGELYLKPTAVMAVGTTGGFHARQTTARALLWQGAYLVGELGIASPRTKMTGDTWSDAATVEAMVALVEQLLEAPRADHVALGAGTAATAAALGIHDQPRR